MKASRAMAKLARQAGQQAETLAEVSAQVKRLERKLDAALKIFRDRAASTESE